MLALFCVLFGEVLLQELVHTDLYSDEWLDDNFTAKQQKAEDDVLESNP